MTTSSNEAAKAKSAPEIMPGATSGRVTRKKVVTGSAPRLAEARIRLLSKPDSVAVMVMTTNGTPSAVCARMMPSVVWASPIVE